MILTSFWYDIDTQRNQFASKKTIKGKLNPKGKQKHRKSKQSSSWYKREYQLQYSSSQIVNVSEITSFMPLLRLNKYVEAISTRDIEIDFQWQSDFSFKYKNR